MSNIHGSFGWHVELYKNNPMAPLPNKSDDIDISWTIVANKRRGLWFEIAPHCSRATRIHPKTTCEKINRQILFVIKTDR